MHIYIIYYKRVQDISTIQENKYIIFFYFVIIQFKDTKGLIKIVRNYAYFSYNILYYYYSIILLSSQLNIENNLIYIYF